MGRNNMEFTTDFKHWLQIQSRDARWCILINADPDALASAMALRRILRPRSRVVDIAHINAVTRPDNLAMIRYLRIPLTPWQPEIALHYNHFALLDSQPQHSHLYAGLQFHLIIDHHPATNLSGQTAPDAFISLCPGAGATATLMTRLLRSLGIRPGPLLATALIYGIRTDTATLERSGGESDLRAYQWLSRHANSTLLRRISRSEYLREWLPLFSRAFRSLVDCQGGGAHASLEEVKSADLLVSIADFFTRVHGLKWIAVSGVVAKTVVVIFRGDGGRDIGNMAKLCFGDMGEAGGHRTLARAEFPLNSLPEGVKAAGFVRWRLQSHGRRKDRQNNGKDAGASGATR